jgi:hypothetical protein
MRGDPFSSPYGEKQRMTQPGNIGLIAGAATLALLGSGAIPMAAEVGLCSLVAKPANFDRQAVTLQGTATAVKKTTSRQGNNYTLFKLEDPRGCGAIYIFTRGHPKFSNGDHVRVEGVFETVHHQDRSIFYNQVEATRVVPLPK